MHNRVGAKGQVVIEKEIRDRLGVKPGWQAVQLLAEDHVRIYFVPPEHNESLFGAARPFIRGKAPPAEEWDERVAGSIAAEFLGKSDAE
jgi:AbrB family looped-hinge helix DNA binding protein